MNQNNKMTFLAKVFYYSLLSMILFYTNNAIGQPIDRPELINGIKKDVTLFFIKKDILNKQEVGNSLNFVFVTEILSEKIIGYQEVGIYTIGVNQSHSDRAILIKEGSNYKIYDLKELVETINAIQKFSKKHKIKDTQLALYLQHSCQLYLDNHTSSVTIEKKSN